MESKIDLTVELDNVIPTQLDVNELENDFVKDYCKDFEVKNVEIQNEDLHYIVLKPDTLGNFIVSIIRNYDRYLEKLDY
ncbi:MAG: hypothetical protein WCG93_06400 [Paludibacter sp.]